MKNINYFTCMAYVFFSLHAFAADDIEPKTIFEPLYAQLKLAMAERNLKGINALLAPEFKSEDISGNVIDAELLVSTLSKLPKDPNKKLKTTVLSVSIKEGLAYVKQKYVVNTIAPVEDSQTPKNVEVVTTSDDVWEKQNGVWLLRSTVTQDMLYSVEGKEVSRRLPE